MAARGNMGSFVGLGESAPTGFSFGIGGGDAVDIASEDRGLFAGIGTSDRPAFDEYTSALRTPLSSYAAAASRGNVQAAGAYQESLGLFRDAQRRYGAARGIGINDRTATACLRISDQIGSILSKDLTTTTESYKDRFSSYLAAQAKQRGFSPDKLIGEENELDAGFRSAYERYRSGSKSTDPREMTDLDGTFRQAPGFAHDMSLGIRMALSRYEGSNGLYSTIDRRETLDEAARLLNRIHGNSKLNARFGTDYDAVIDMAAKRVLRDDKSANLIDLIDGDLATIQNGFVTYSGTTAGDAAYGFEVKDRSGRSFTTALAPCVQGVLVDQAIEDRINGVERFSDKNALKAKFADRLSRLYSGAGIDADDATKNLVYGTVADKLVEMTGKGNVNLTSLAGLWLKNPGFHERELPTGPVFDWNRLGDFGDRMVDKFIGGRPAIAANFEPAPTSNNFTVYGDVPYVLSDKKDPQFYDAKTIRKNVQSELKTYLREAGIDKDLLDRNADAVQAYADRVAEMIHYANTVGDPRIAMGDDQKGYKNGARAMLAGLTMAQNLKDIGFDVPEFDFGTATTNNSYWFSTNDPGYRYRDAKVSFDNAFGGLYEYLNSYVGRIKDPAALDDAGFVRYQAALSYRDGIDALRSSVDGSVKDDKTIKAKRAFASSRLGLRLDGVDDYGTVDAARSATGLDAVQAAWKARNATGYKESRELADPSMFKARMMLDRLLEQGFSDRINPVQTRRIDELAVNLMDVWGSGFTPGSATYDSRLGQIRQAVSTAASDLGTFRPMFAEDGSEYMGWDPVAPLLGNTALESAIVKRINPTLQRVKAMSNAVEAERAAMAGRLAEARSGGNIEARLKRDM